MVFSCVTKLYYVCQSFNGKYKKGWDLGINILKYCSVVKNPETLFIKSWYTEPMSLMLNTEERKICLIYNFNWQFHDLSVIKPCWRADNIDKLED